MRHTLFLAALRRLAVCRLAVCACLLPLALNAQGVSNPKAEAILAETLAALGGEKFQNVHTMEESGRAYSFRRGRLSGLAVIRQVTRYPDPSQSPAGAPAIQERQYLGKKEELSSLILYDRGFEITYRGFTPMDEETTQRIRESRLHNFLYIARQRLPHEKYVVEYIGSRLLRNQQLVGIRLVDPEYRVTELWVNQSTKLPVRQEFVRRDPKSNLPIEEVTEWDKYRELGAGVFWPQYVLRESRGQKVFEMFTDAVTLNPNLAESVFQLPQPAPRARDQR
ncbi:MAG: hypothetical protein MUF01_00040 [Bryobacterales bacterium]|jgi:hypothetical protein|nr:hypothetical protein [Bryobacterales bacterium]